MKNTIIAITETLTENYRESMMEFIECHREDQSMGEHADDLINVARDLQQMSSEDNNMCLRGFKRAFRDGFTMMMLPHEFDRLETWSRNDEDFRVALFRTDGTAVGIVNKHEISW